MKKPIYLDFNSTTPIDHRVADSMLPYINTFFGNPSSSHYYGVQAKTAIENARKKVADLLECKVDEIIFTSGGSESNNFAIRGIAFAKRNNGNHIITSSIEHPAVYEVCRFLETQGFIISYLPVDEFGLVDPNTVEQAITPNTILITIMHSNNEVGTIQPNDEISKIAASHGITFHSDCAQSIGKIKVSLNQNKIDLLSLAGHKFYAPKGIGVLYIRSGLKPEKLIYGANHEMNFRSGTENVVEIVGIGTASEIVRDNFSTFQNQMKKTRDRLEEKIKEYFPDVKINGHPVKRLPNTLSISFRGIEANTILSELTNVAASAGAACHSDSIDISPTLTAMNVPVEYAIGTIRFSTGRTTTMDEIDLAADEIKNVIEKLIPSKVAITVNNKIDEINLTRYTHGLGCACKLRPQLLEEILKKIPLPENKNILVGSNTSDDAAVYKIDESTAIVQTVDFFTPVVDDPFEFGAIAASNSLSDIYAMGAEPLFALNIVGFPSNRLPMEVLHKILLGAQSIADKAEISIIGGHSIDDPEPKFGWSVTGKVNPNKVVRNSTSQIGDSLILTKPIGTGILSTALKQNLLSDEIKTLLINTMRGLNKEASAAMMEVGVSACTDITGFGLMGHLLEMMLGSNLSAIIDSEKIPVITGAYDLAAAGIIPGGSKNNFEHTLKHIKYSENISETRKFIFNDAQTSGGLLISIPERKVFRLSELLERYKITSASVIGKIISPDKNRIIIE